MVANNNSLPWMNSRLKKLLKRKLSLTVKQERQMTGQNTKTLEEHVNTNSREQRPTILTKTLKKALKVIIQNPYGNLLNPKRATT